MASSNNSTNITFTTASPGSTTNTSTNVSAAATSPTQEPASSSSLQTTPSTVSSARAGGSTTSEEKILSRFTSILLADGSRKKIEVADHFKRLAYLRKEADQLEKTDWQYEGVEQLLGN